MTKHASLGQRLPLPYFHGGRPLVARCYRSQRRTGWTPLWRVSSECGQWVCPRVFRSLDRAWTWCQLASERGLIQ